jgi:hypothetical protein
MKGSTGQERKGEGVEIAREQRGWAGDRACRANRTGTADISYSAIQVCPAEAEEEFAQALSVEPWPVLLVAPDIVGRRGVSLADGSHADARSEGCGLPSFLSLTRRVTDPGLFVIHVLWLGDHTRTSLTGNSTTALPVGSPDGCAFSGVAWIH